jgi:hypothetical protein
MVILENRTKRPPRMLVFNLDINLFAVKVENQILVKGKDGQERKKRTSKRSPDSLRIPAQSQTEPLPEKILHCKKIKEAIRNKEIAVIEVKDQSIKNSKVKTRIKKDKG